MQIQSAREEYASGLLTLLQLEWRIDVALGIRPEVEVHIGIPTCCFRRHVVGVMDCAESERIKDLYGIRW